MPHLILISIITVLLLARALWDRSGPFDGRIRLAVLCVLAVSVGLQWLAYRRSSRKKTKSA